MAAGGKIERAGKEADVLAMAARGMGARRIAKELAKQGLKISHTAVNRFLTEETKDRERARRATTAATAAEVAGKVAPDVDDNLGRLRSLIGPLMSMGLHAVRQVQLPDVADVRSDDETYAAKIEEGVRAWWEPIAAKDQIRAAGLAKDILAYLVELAGANPRPTDPKNLEAIRAAIADVFGYSAEPDPSSPAEAPLSSEEHTPPVTH